MIEARDGHGGTDVQRFTLHVTTGEPNDPPEISSTGPVAAQENRPYSYQVVASDPNLTSGDFLDVSKTQSRVTTNPIELDDFGRLRWQSTAVDFAAGYVDVTVSLTDSFGKLAMTKTLRITPTTDNKGPNVAVFASHSAIQINNSITFTVNAVDDVDGPNVKDIVLHVGANTYPVGPTRQVTVLMDTASNDIPFYATAKDQKDNEGTSPTQEPLVFDPFDLSPLARITAPADDFTITETVDVFGIVDDPENGNFTYTVSLIPVDAVDESARITLGTFAGERGNSGTNTGAALGAQIVPTSLPNGNYWLELFVTDGVSAPDSDFRLVTIQSQHKLGNFNLSFTDLETPVAGIPLTITRTYDSLKADEVGDFGHGWSMNLVTGKLDIQLTDNPLNDYWRGQGLEPALFYGSQMTITLPGGEELRFTAEPVPLNSGGPYGAAGGLLGLADLARLPVGRRSGEQSVDRLPLAILGRVERSLLDREGRLR